MLWIWSFFQVHSCQGICFGMRINDFSMLSSLLMMGRSESGIKLVEVLRFVVILLIIFVRVAILRLSILLRILSKILSFFLTKVCSSFVSDHGICSCKIEVD